MKTTSRGKGFKSQTIMQGQTHMTIEEQLAIKESVATAEHKKFDKDAEELKAIKRDAEMERVTAIPVESSDLLVVTALKRLTTYVLLVTQKSPKQYRSVFVSRMQNYCIDALEHLFAANGVNVKTQQGFDLRKGYQDFALQKLKLLSYVGMVAEQVNCILPKQYKQISFLIADSINLISAWKKSDSERWHDKKME